MMSRKARMPLAAPAVAAALIALMLCGCGRDDRAAKAPEKTGVVATTLSVYVLALGVRGEARGFELSMLLPAGTGCPHDYELTMGDMKKLSHARAVLANGAGLEEFLLTGPVKSLKLKVVDLSEGLALIPLSPEEKAEAAKEAGHEGHVHAGEYNPHVFASPRNAARMTEHLGRAFAELDPANAEAYRKNAAEQAREFDALADLLAAAAATFPNRKIVTNHDVFAYLARDLGLEVVAVIEREPGQPPGVGAFAKLIDKVKQERPAAIFYEPQYGAGPAGELSKGTGVPLHELDPFASGEPRAGACLAAWRRNLETLKKAMGPK
jgi:zinc transport system substrate-binding protein